MDERKFYMLDAELTARKDITLADKVIYSVIANYQGQKDYCWPSISRLGGDTGLSRDTVIKSIQKLTEIGLLICHKNGRGKSNCYQVQPVEFYYQSKFATSRDLQPEVVEICDLNQSKFATCSSRDLQPEVVEICDPNITSEKNYGKEPKKRTRENNSSLSRLEKHLGRKLNEYEKNDLAHWEKMNGFEWCLEAVKLHPEKRYIGQAFEECQKFTYDLPDLPLTLEQMTSGWAETNWVESTEHFTRLPGPAQLLAGKTAEEWSLPENRWEFATIVEPWLRQPVQKLPEETQAREEIA